jgi:putative toxin-antitoxin system antitoxin component (TIGR02293 family)
MDVPDTSHTLISDTDPSFWLIADQLNARNENERLDYIRSGFPPGWVKELRHAFHLNNAQLETLLGTSISTLERRQRQQRPLDTVSSERLDRVTTLALHAAELFENRNTARRWMITANRALNDQMPISLCETEIGARQVRRVLGALQHGGVV